MLKLTDRGVTLIELLLAMSIAAILLLVLGFQFAGWKGRYNVEKTIKDVYSSLTDARERAVQLNRAYFFDISADGRFYRVTADDSTGAGAVAKSHDGDGVFQQQSPWATIIASSPLSWGTEGFTTDTTVTALSRQVQLQNIASTGPVPFNSPKMAGLLSGWFSVQWGWNFRMGFDNRGMARNMVWSSDPATGNAVIAPATSIATAIPYENPNWLWGNPTICIFTDYDGDGVSDYDPDYDCIIVSQTKITLGKITRQNTFGGGDWCREANCVAK